VVVLVAVPSKCMNDHLASEQTYTSGFAEAFEICRLKSEFLFPIFQNFYQAINRQFVTK